MKEQKELQMLTEEQLAETTGGLSRVPLTFDPARFPERLDMADILESLGNRFGSVASLGPQPLRPRLMNAYPADLIELVEELDLAERDPQTAG